MADDSASDSGSKGLVNRRTLLQAGAAVLGTAAVGHAAGAAAERHGISFDRRVDIVEEFGADPTGGSAIDDALDRAIETGTLIVFPEGTYRIDGTVDVTADRVGFLGQGDVVFEPRGVSGKTVRVDGYDRFLFEGIDIDIRDARDTGLRLHCPTKFHLEDVEYLGRGGETGQALNIGIHQEDGVGVVRGFTSKHGGYMDLYNNGNGRIGVWAGIEHVGTVRFVDCDFREYGNNGLYTSRTPGDIQVTDSYFENNNVTSVRISGAGSWVKDSTFVVDHSRYEYDFQYTDEAFNTRAVRIDQAKNVTLEEFPPKTEPTSDSVPVQERGAVVQNCDIRVLDTVGEYSCRGAVVMNAAAQSTTIQDSHIQVDVDGVPAIYRIRPGWNFREDQDTPPKPHWVHVRNVTLTGTAANGYAVRIEEGDGSYVRDSCFQLPGADRGGVEFVDTASSAVESTNLNVDGQAVSSRNSELTTEGLTYGESCPVPDAGRDGDDTLIGSEPEYDHELVVESARSADVFEYTVTVTGDATPVTEGTFSANPGDEVDSSTDPTTITGTVGAGGGDTYRFDGQLTAASIDGPGEVRVDGDTLLQTDDTAGDSIQRHELVIESARSADVFEYAVTVTGDAIPVTEGTLSANPTDGDSVTEQDGNSYISGTVGGGGGDTYAFYGEVLDAELGGDGTVRVDGDPLDLSRFDSYDHELVVVSDRDADVFEYTVTVTGDATPVTEGTLSANPGDGVTRHDGVTTVAGTVGGGGGDTYRFDGRVVTASIGGPATVYIDGLAVPEGELGMEHRIEFVGSGVASGSYEFTVDDAVAGDPDAPSGTVEGPTGSGTVESGTHAYYYDGAVADCTVDGPAGVYRDGEQVDPAALGADGSALLPNRLLFDGSSSEGSASYSFEVTGDVERSYGTGSIETADTVEEARVSGTVEDDVDAYRFSGNVQSLALTGNGTIRFADEDGS